MPERIKTCTKCKATKPTAAFAKHSRSKDGLQCWCRDCKAMQNKKTYDPERQRAYQQKNRAAIRERKRRYRQRNAKREAERVRQWHAAHPDRVKEHKKRHAAKHPGRDLARLQKFMEENPDRKNMGRKELRDKYVAWVMTRREPRLKPRDIPPSVVAAKKVQLHINRAIKEAK